MLARIPIRLRLTFAFALLMAAVLALAGLALHDRLGSSLDDALAERLEGRSADVAAIAADDAAWDSAVTATGFVQVLTPDGRVVASASPLGQAPALTADELRQVEESPVAVDRDRLPGGDDPVRLRGELVSTADGDRVVVVGASLEPREEALEGLRTQMLIGGPLLLLLSSAAAYGLAAAALRPVEAMRSEAEAVSAAEPGRRLPLPPADDEIRALGTTLNEMLARLEAALERERRFVADASHELRTPLASLRAEIELALRRERSPEELRSALVSAGEETERLSRLADDLLVLARSEEGGLPVRRERLRIAALLGDVRRRFAQRAQASGRPLDVAVEDGLELSGDRLRLEQALGNLVDNALRHGEGPVVMRAVRADGRIELHVEDGGAGISAELVPHAFEPFTRVDGRSSSPGAGLGLAIVDAIARAHGGEAHAAAGGGDVWLSLPPG